MIFSFFRHDRFDAHPVDGARRQAWPTLWLALATSLVLAACSGNSDRTQPLPLGEGHPTAYTETYLAQHPEALVQPGHVVVLHQEAANYDSGDTGTGHGVDEIAYHVATAMTVTLKTDADSPTLSHLVLRDDNGHEVGRHHRDSAEPVIVTLQPGRYWLEVHHRSRGDRSVTPATIFIRLGEAGTVMGDPRATALRAGLSEPSGNLNEAPTMMLATASADCLNCTFNDSDMSNGKFDGVDYSGSTFSNTKLNSASFVGARCIGCSFVNSWLVSADFTSATLDNSVFTDTDMESVSIVPGTAGGASCQHCSFSGEHLSNMHLWGATMNGSTFTFGADIYVIDLSGSQCNSCWLKAESPRSIEILHLGGANAPLLKLYQLNIGTGNFQGAHLLGASMESVTCTTCNFNSARAKSTLYTNTIIGKGVWDDADLSEALVADAASRLASAPGSSFARADMSQMRPRNYPAVQTSCCGTSNPIDFSGTKFAGLDLSGADFSNARAIVTKDTDFGGATLSNGSSGINLSGQRLSGITTLANADLRGAMLERVELLSTDLSGANFSAVHLRGSVLTGSKLVKAIFTGAQLGVDPGTVGAAKLIDTELAGADFSSADLRMVDLTRARGMGGVPVSFTGAHLESALVVEALLPQADFGNAVLIGAQFTRSVLTMAVFSGTTLLNAVLDDTDLYGANFDGASNAHGLSLVNAQLFPGDPNVKYYDQDCSVRALAPPTIQLGPIETTTDLVCPSGGRGPCTGDALIGHSRGPDPRPSAPPC